MTICRVAAWLMLAASALPIVAEAAQSPEWPARPVRVIVPMGPGGGSDTKPVGLVHFGAARRGQPVRHREHRFGDIGRSEVRLATVREALTLLRELI